MLFIACVELVKVGCMNEINEIADRLKEVRKKSGKRQQPFADTWNLQQKLYRNQPGSALKRNSKVKRLRLSAWLRKPVFHWQNTNWIPLKHESLLFSMPQAQ